MRRTFLALDFMTVAPMVTWPSPAMATAAPLRTAITVVPWNSGAPGLLLRGMGVGPPVDLLQLLQADVGVDLGGGKTRVAEHLLHGADIRPPIQEVRGKRMPERVRGYA